MGIAGIALILQWPALLPHPALGVLGFVTIELTAILQLATLRPSLLKIEESMAGLAAILIIGVGNQHVTALSLLWLVAVASGVMARGGRVHWFGSAVVLGSLAAPVVLLLWFWLSALIVLIGSEIDAELEHSDGGEMRPTPQGSP